MDKKECPIGVFDSGMGGISVLRELVRLMPEEDYLYFGDSINAPYGTKELEAVRELTIKNIEYLMDRGAKSVVVACNTATSAAVKVLRSMYPELPLVGIEPAIKPATMEHPGGRVVVMATPMTLRQEKFQTLMSKFDKQAEIIPLPCPGLMEYVERGELTGQSLHKYLTELLWSVQDKPIDSIVLGCTHYPFVRKEIQAIVGPEVMIYDGGPGTAREMRRRLEVAGLRTERTTKGKVVFENSLDTKEKQALEKMLLMDVD